MSFIGFPYFAELASMAPRDFPQGEARNKKSRLSSRTDGLTLHNLILS